MAAEGIDARPSTRRRARSSRRDRLVRRQPGQLGRAGAGPRRLPGLRRRAASSPTPTPSATSSRSTGRCSVAVDGLRGVHLQCHIGTDTVSLARLGARMTGLDFSPAALVEARRLAARAGADVDFVEADVYRRPTCSGAGAFDLVFTGIGALIWLPDIDRWARWWRRCCGPAAGCSSARATRCCSRSPTPDPTGCWPSSTRYFEHAEPNVYDEPGTYVATDVEFEHNRQPRVEPRARRDRHGAARPRHGADDVRRARQRAVGRPARADGGRSAAASGG